MSEVKLPYLGPRIPVENFTDALRSCKGIPYIWGGKDPHGLDCSGCITYALWLAAGTLRLDSFPDLRETWSADRLLKASGSPVAVKEFSPGMLALYGMKSHATHVMAVWEGGGVYGACGGGSGCTTREQANKIDAKVKFKPSFLYRSDLIGVYRLPFIDYGVK